MVCSFNNSCYNHKKIYLNTRKLRAFGVIFKICEGSQSEWKRMRICAYTECKRGSSYHLISLTFLSTGLSKA